MAEGRSTSPKPEISVTDTEEDTQGQLHPGPSTRSSKKKAAVIPKSEIELSTLLKFIKPFDGCREKLNSFLVNCNNAYEIASDTQKDILFKYILCQLQGKAETACSIKEFTNWHQLKEFLKTQFSERKHYAHLLTELQECKQQVTETVSQYALRIETCLSHLLTEISISHGHKSREMIGRSAAMEELALHHFQMGLTPRISNFVRSKSVKTLNEAINIAISEERIQQSLSKHSAPSSNQQSRQFIRRNQNPSSFKNNPTTPRPNNNNSILVCRYCKNPGHTIEQCRKREFNNNRFKNPDQNYTRQPRVHFISDETSETNDDFLTNPEGGYDTVDSNQKNE
ncbi:uncharacterized protein LOC128681842 [Plodia interpunctella]|uniref:uncharacterized protein LOC128673574 n=1 Tax=Plodia interpunctella TaxID=58824 RepID=UPI0023688D58|nr:uncharacterized protein LOC128673574 [Plodia interpunctella]XP_053622043.1 uncharacterized protein LOC128681842 [Plodia interpunctella]